MPKTSIYINIFIYILLGYFITISPSGANELLERNLIPVELFSTGKIQYISVNNPIKIKQNQITLNTKLKWIIEAKDHSLRLFSKISKEEIKLPKEITLLPETNKGICLDSKNTHGRCYKGTIKIKTNGKNILILNEVPLIDYINSVVGSELPLNWPSEAVKAQTVVIHSYLLNTLKNSKPLKDSTQDQFYGGATYENSSYREYTNKVKNVIIVDKEHKPIKALYHSTCAGKTLNNENVFGGKPLNYLRSKPCKFDSDSNFAKLKTLKISLKKLKTLFKTTSIYFKKTVKDQLINVQLDHTVLTPYEFWLKLGQNIGWGAVPGVKYNINCNNSICTINSKGAGHAVGLCQWGARGMAKKGFNYKDILGYYYKNISFLDISFNKRVQK